MTFENIVRQRRSINFFDPEKDLSQDLLETMVNLAAQTPSSFNLQPWNLMIVRDPAQKEKLKALAWDQPKITEAPVDLIVLADKNGWQKGHPVFEKTWEQMLAAGGMGKEQREWFESATSSLYNWSADANLAFAAKNAGFFAMSLMYAATSLGLDSHPMDGFDHEGVKKAFNIPDQYWVPLIIAVGYKAPDLELQPPKWRKGYDELVVSF